MTFIAELVQSFFSQIILYRITRLVKFFSRCRFFVHRQLGFFSDNSKIQVGKKNQGFELSKRQLSFADKDIVEEGCVGRDEVEQVMGSLGIFCNPAEGEKLPGSISCTYLYDIFEEEQPRLDEVKGAFDVFDENRDGFIDAKELHRVLSALGMDRAADMDDCRKMIRVFDENADGRIDFDEFLKFMEKSFC